MVASKFVKVLKGLSMRLASDWKSDKGFTLIEAVASIVIVGLVVIPIGTIFSGVLANTMETKEKFQATQIAQQYIEAVKSMSFEEVEKINSKPITNENAKEYEMPELPKGYSVEVTYEDGTTETFNKSPFSWDEDKMPKAGTVNADVIIYISKIIDVEGKEDNGFYCADTDIETIKGSTGGTNYIGGNKDDEKKRDINLLIKTYVDKKDDSIDETKISYIVTDPTKDPPQEHRFDDDDPNGRPTIVIYCDNQESTNVVTKVNVMNETGYKIYLDVFEELDDVVNPMIVVGGNVNVSTGLSEGKVYSQRIYKVTVVVKLDEKELEKVILTVNPK